jgi:hypothetical protein
MCVDACIGGPSKARLVIDPVPFFGNREATLGQVSATVLSSGAVGLGAWHRNACVLTPRHGW